jgi:2-methylcitrate dehydratase PrpD
MTQTDSSTPTTVALGELIAAVRPDDIGDRARDAAKLCILDLVGCAVAGYDEAPAQATRSWVRAEHGAGPASVWLSGSRSSVLGASMANAAAGCALDGDDLHWEAILHAGASLVPTAIAAAEATGASGDQLLEALTIGYEVACRIGAAVDWDTLGQIATGSWSGWGAAAVLAYLNGGRAQDYASAFAVVGALKPVVLPPGLTINRNGVKEGIGWGTYAGIAAQQLGSWGLTGPPECLDNDLLNRDRILAPMNDRFEVEAVEFKPYVCCAWTHAGTDVLLGLMDEHDLAPDDIEHVEVTSFTTTLTMLDNRPDPPTIQAAQYNVPFVLAIAANLGKAGLLPLTEDLLGRPDLIDFASRVSLKASSDFDAQLPHKRPVNVVLETRKGRLERGIAKDTTPSDLDAVAEKFRLLTRRCWSPQTQSRVISEVASLSGDVTSLSELLNAAPTPVVAA